MGAVSLGRLPYAIQIVSGETNIANNEKKYIW